ncbi:MAG: CARDB domain-containing protein, partial [Verrucomicrobiota bacterium]|nr:CARDB domain-containing protein [Verrucomicrobiota bacterium]
ILEVTFPKIAPGTYYLILRTDEQDTIFEADETDHVQAFAIELLAPNLVPTAATVNGTAHSGMQVKVQFSVSNLGNGPIQGGISWRDRLYLSSDQIWNISDHLLSLGASQSSAIGAGEGYSQNLEITLPQVTEGTYYLILKTDFDDSVFESDETDNVLTQEITILGEEAPQIIGIQVDPEERIVLSFIGVPGYRYVLQTCVEIGTAWEDIGAPILCEEGINTFIAESDGTSAFFRMRLYSRE